MSSEEKNQPNKSSNRQLWLKQAGFILLVLLWLAAILFKHQMTGPVRIIVFVVLLLLTAGELVWLNKTFSQLGK